MERVTEFFKKNKYVLLVLAAGLVLLLWPTKTVESAAQPVTAAETAIERQERRIEAVLGEARGVGDIRVMLGERDGELTGCVIVCGGGDARAVVLDLTEAVSRLTGLGSDKIKVITMKGGVQ